MSLWCRGGVKYYIKLCKKYRIPVQAVIETNETRWGQCYEGYPIMGPEEATERFSHFYIIISAPAHAEEITNNISKYDSVSKIFCFDASVDITQNRDIVKYKEYIEKNINVLNQMNEEMADDLSKNVLKNILYNWITYDCDCLRATNERTQYFPEIIKERLNKNEVFVDCGAFDGDTILEFLEEQTKGFRKIYAFEPDQANLKQIKKMPEWATFKDKIVLLDKGVYDHTGSMFFSSKEEGQIDEAAHITEEKEASGKIDVVALDDIIKEKITYIKMDIEGSEKKALEGAKRILTAYRPKLAVCVYHRYDDLIDIYQYITHLGMDYKVYLRHYWNCSGTDVVLFAV